MVCHKTLENQLIPPNNEKCRDANIVTNNKTADIPTAYLLNNFNAIILKLFLSGMLILIISNTSI